MDYLTLLLTLLAGFAALAYLPMSSNTSGWSRSIVKTTPLLCLTLASFLSNGPAFLTVALFLSALGDFALSRPGRTAFLYGLSAFGLAHILFVLLFSMLAQEPLWVAFLTNPIPAIAILALGFSSEIWLAPFTGAMRWPVRIYVVLISAMALAALTLPAIYGLVVAGAGVFVISDLILSLRLFRLKDPGPIKRLSGFVVWVFYTAGQWLIFWGILSA